MLCACVCALWWTRGKVLLSFWTFARLIFQFSPRQINVRQFCFDRIVCAAEKCLPSRRADASELQGQSPWPGAQQRGHWWVLGKVSQAEGSELTLRLWWLCSAVSHTLIFCFCRFSLTLIDTLDTLVVRISLFFSAFKRAGTFERLYDFMFFEPPPSVWPWEQVLNKLDEFEDAVRKAVSDVRLDNDVVVSVFETNIRVLGYEPQSFSCCLCLCAVYLIRGHVHGLIVLSSFQRASGSSRDGWPATSARGEDAVVPGWTPAHGQGAWTSIAACL